MSEDGRPYNPWGKISEEEKARQQAQAQQEWAWEVELQRRVDAQYEASLLPEERERLTWLSRQVALLKEQRAVEPPQGRQQAMKRQQRQWERFLREFQQKRKQELRQHLELLTSIHFNREIR